MWVPYSRLRHIQIQCTGRYTFSKDYSLFHTHIHTHTDSDDLELYVPAKVASDPVITRLTVVG